MPDITGMLLDYLKKAVDDAVESQCDKLLTSKGFSTDDCAKVVHQCGAESHTDIKTIPNCVMDVGKDLLMAKATGAFSDGVSKVENFFR